MPRGIPITPSQLREAAKLQSQFKTLDFIAQKLGLNPESLCRALSRYNRRLFARMESRRAAEAAEQVAILKSFAIDLYAEWERSKNPRIKTRTNRRQKGVGAANSEAEVSQESLSQTGNPAIAAQVRGVLADVREILGITSSRDGQTSAGDYNEGPHTIPDDDPRFVEAGELPPDEGVAGANAPT